MASFNRSCRRLGTEPVPPPDGEGEVLVELLGRLAAHVCAHLTEAMRSGDHCCAGLRVRVSNHGRWPHRTWT